MRAWGAAERSAAAEHGAARRVRRLASALLSTALAATSLIVSQLRSDLVELPDRIMAAVAKEAQEELADERDSRVRTAVAEPLAEVNRLVVTASELPDGVVNVHFTYEFVVEPPGPLPVLPSSAITVALRELSPGTGAAAGAKAFHNRGSADVTGWSVWAASVVAARWLASGRGAALLDGAEFAELGAGCGLAGLVAARLPSRGPAAVALTDCAAGTLANLRFNVAANPPSPGTVLRVRHCDWDAPPAEAAAALWGGDGGGGGGGEAAAGRRRVVLGCDVAYSRAYGRKLLPLLRAALPRGGGGAFVLATPAAREGLPVLRAALAAPGAGWRLAEETEAPPEWRRNPLARAAAAAEAAAGEADAGGDGEGLDAGPRAVQLAELFPELAMASHRCARARVRVAWSHPEGARLVQRATNGRAPALTDLSPNPPSRAPLCSDPLLVLVWLRTAEGGDGTDGEGGGGGGGCARGGGGV